MFSTSPTKTIVLSWLVLIFSTVVHAQNCTDYYTCQLSLYDQLLSKSRASLRPVQSDAQTVLVRLGFSMIKLVSVNEEDGLLTIRAHLNQTWNASVLAWNSALNGNVQHFRVPAHSVWTPKVELVNPSTVIDFEANHFVNIWSSGLCELSYSTLLTTPCNFDINNFPFDQQTCTFKLGSSLYDINEVSLSQAIDFVIDEAGLVPSGYKFISSTNKQQSAFFAGFDRSYDQIAIDLTIRRQPTYFVRLLNWPGSILAFLTLTIFLLPPGAPERLVYGALLLLCQFLLLLMFAVYTPKRLGTTWPWMGRTIFYDICLTSMSLVFSVLVRMLSDGKYFSMQRLPIRTRNFILGFSTKLIGFKRLSYATLLANRESDYDTNEPSASNDSAMEPLTSVTNHPAAASMDGQVASSSTIARDVGSIKQKVHAAANEHSIHQEWILLAHIVNRLCFIAYLFFFSFSIGHHLFHR